MSEKKPSYLSAAIWSLSSALVMICGAGALACWAIHLLHAADSPRKPKGANYQPEMMIITTEQHVRAEAQLSYWSGFSSAIGDLALTGGQSGTFPTGIRSIRITFSGAQPGSNVQYAILLNRDASESSISGQPFATSRNPSQNPVSVGSPGRVIANNNCELPENTSFAQIMYGSLTAASDGTADTQIAGKLVNQHPYLTSGDTDIVNVIEFVPTAAAATNTTARSSGCHWLFPDWPYLGGVQWYSPATLTGSVVIGSLQKDYTVQSSNPILADLSSLSWDFSGPTSINYILADDSITRQAGDNLFFAGVLAAAAIGLAVEFLKSIFELHAKITEVREGREALKEKFETTKKLQREKEALAALAAGTQEVQKNVDIIMKALFRPTLGSRIASAVKRKRVLRAPSDGLTRPNS